MRKGLGRIVARELINRIRPKQWVPDEDNGKAVRSRQRGGGRQMAGDRAEVTVDRHELFELRRRPQIVRMCTFKGCPTFPEAAPEAGVDARSGVFEDVVVDQNSGSGHNDSLAQDLMIASEARQVLRRF